MIRSSVCMVLFGLIVRVLYIVFTHSYRFSPADWRPGDYRWLPNGASKAFFYSPRCWGSIP